MCCDVWSDIMCGVCDIIFHTRCCSGPQPCPCCPAKCIELSGAREGEGPTPSTTLARYAGLACTYLWREGATSSPVALSTGGGGHGVYRVESSAWWGRLSSVLGGVG